MYIIMYRVGAYKVLAQASLCLCYLLVAALDFIDKLIDKYALLPRLWSFDHSFNHDKTEETIIYTFKEPQETP